MIDTRGYGCPIPVVMVQKAMKKEKPARLEVLSDNEYAVENITRLANSMGYELRGQPQGEDHLLILTKK